MKTSTNLASPEVLSVKEGFTVFQNSLLSVTDLILSLLENYHSVFSCSLIRTFSFT